MKNYLKGSDLGEREDQILAESSRRLGFIPAKILSRSAWFGSSEIGAFHYSGEYKGKKAVLKIQGVKPSVSEIYMIQSFSKANKSQLIRPPKLYAYLEWDEAKKYEALVLEDIEGDTLIKAPTNQDEIDEFFKAYQDYRANCLDEPWLDKPDGTLAEGIENNFADWRKISFKIYPEHPLRQKGDEALIDEAVKVLKKGYRGVEAEFLHGHFSARDLYRVGDQVVVLSNLYWSFRQPFYDAVFAYHWFIYQLNDIEDITQEEVENQRSLWLNKIRSLPQAKNHPTLLNLALLERAAAGLNLDVLSADSKKPITPYLVKSTRDQIKKLIGLLN